MELIIPKLASLAENHRRDGPENRIVRKEDPTTKNQESQGKRQARNNGSKFTILSVATQRSWKNAEDEWVSKVEWHRVAPSAAQLIHCGHAAQGRPCPC